MIQPDSLRGHAIYFDGQEFRYSDNHQSTIETWKDRPCGHCGLHNTMEGHDGCLGTLPGVLNACCGHGVDRSAYIQYTDGTEVRGDAAMKLSDVNDKHVHYTLWGGYQLTFRRFIGWYCFLVALFAVGVVFFLERYL